MKITITLSASGMGEAADETDFDLWANYVASTMPGRVGLDVAVDQFAFTGRGSWPEDKIEIVDTTDYDAADEVTETVKRALGDLYESFCGETWDAMRRAHDAAATAA